jgi:hypothetical protein
MTRVGIEFGEGVETPGSLVYRLSDYAFDFQPAGVATPTIVRLGYVQVEVDSTGRCRYAWGYSPFPGWEVARLPEMPEPTSSACVLVNDFEAGDVLTVVKPADSITTIDPRTGSVWVRAVDATENPYHWARAIASGVVLLGWEDGSLGGLLLTATNSSEILNVVRAL